MFGVVTSVATARPAAAVRPGASARAATAAARPGAHARARLAVPRARVLARASARLPAVAAVAAPLAFVSPAVRRASSRRAPLRRARGGSLVAGGAEKSSSAESSTAVASDDVDALAERLDKLKEKSRAMLAEAEALEKSVTDEKNDKAETSAGGASATEAETAATSKQTPAASSSTTVKKLDPEGDGKEATAKKTKAEPLTPEGAEEEQSEQKSVVESVRVLSGVVAGASLLAVGGSYAAGATSLLATEPVMALFGSAAAFAAVSIIDAVTPALKKREAAAEAAAAAAKAAAPAKTKTAKPAKTEKPTKTEPNAKPAKTAMPAPVNKPVDASAAKKAALEAESEDMAEGVGSVIKKKETSKEPSPAGAVMRAATPDPVKTDTQWLDPRDAARMSGAARMSNTSDTFADQLESLVKKDTASRVSSPFVSNAFSPLGAGGASVSGSADESKLEELRAIATQRMAKQRMYEEYVKARPAAAGRGVAPRDEKASGRAKESSDSSSPLARFLKLVFFPVLLPFAVVKFVLRLIRNLLGGGKAANGRGEA